MPKVTALRSERAGRARVELDGAPWRALPVEVIARAGLAVGLELDRPSLRLLRRELRRHEAIGEATRALHRRDRSRSDLEQRLAARGVAPDARAEALDALGRAGLVDDHRYAEARAAALAGRGFGDTAIRWRLEQEGLPDDVVTAAIGGLEPEVDRARRIASARQPDAIRIARALGRKGFSPDSIEAALPSAVADTLPAAVRYDD